MTEERVLPWQKRWDIQGGTVHPSHWNSQEGPKLAPAQMHLLSWQTCRNRHVILQWFIIENEGTWGWDLGGRGKGWWWLFVAAVGVFLFYLGTVDVMGNSEWLEWKYDPVKHFKLASRMRWAFRQRSWVPEKGESNQQWLHKTDAGNCLLRLEQGKPTTDPKQGER